jgi:hypothetical protein
MENFEYDHLNGEERDWALFFDYCLFNPDEKIRSAAAKMVELAYDITTKIDTPNALSYVEIEERKKEIYEGLNEVERELIIQFGLAYMNQRDAYREQEDKGRK